GCLSALWHCCPPLWELSTFSGFFGGAIWLLALSLGLGAVGRIACRRSVPMGEVLGAILFACFYPWHTPAWFVQCLIAGAFSTWMVRLTESGWAPTLFLATAYITHMSLPFLAWGGAAIAVCLLVLHMIFGLNTSRRGFATYEAD